MPETLDIPMEKLVEPPQPMRFEIDEDYIAELGADIQRNGQLQPLIVYPEVVPAAVTTDEATGTVSQSEPHATGFYVIADGHCRYLALRWFNAKTAWCVIREEAAADDRSTMVRANLMRRGVSALEEGNIFMEWAALPGMTEALLRAKSGKSLGYIYARMDLVKGDPQVAVAVHEGRIKFGCAAWLNKIDDEAHRRYLLGLCVDMDAKVTQVQDWVRQWQIQTGARQNVPDTAMLPTPAQVPMVSAVRCVLCGGDKDPHNLENVYIHRDELRAYLAALAQVPEVQN